MRSCGAIALALSSTFLSAQSDTTAKASPWSIGAFGLVDQCYRTLVNADNDPDVDQLIDHRDQDEIRYTRCSGMLMVQHDLGEHWQLAAGLGYFSDGFRTKDHSDWQAIGNPADDPALNDLTTRSFSQYEYMALPIMGSYRLGHARCQPFAALGIAPEVLVKDLYIFETEQNGHVHRSEGHDATYRDLGLATCGQIGAAYRLSKHFALRLAANGRYGLVNIIDAPITAHLWSIGGLFGAVYHL